MHKKEMRDKTKTKTKSARKTKYNTTEDNNKNYRDSSACYYMSSGNEVHGLVY